MSSARSSATVGGTGLELRNGYLYYAAVTHIGRFKLTPGELKPAGPAEIVVDGFPVGGGHAEKDIAFDNAGNVYVNIGLPSNACQIPDRRPDAPGIDPCPQLEDRGGIWRFKADVVGQKFTKEARFAIGHAPAGRGRVARRTPLRGDEQPRLARHAVSGEGLHRRRQRVRTERADAAGRAGRRVRLAVLLSRHAA